MVSKEFIRNSYIFGILFALFSIIRALRAPGFSADPDQKMFVIGLIIIIIGTIGILRGKVWGKILIGAFAVTYSLFYSQLQGYQFRGKIIHLLISTALYGFYIGLNFLEKKQDPALNDSQDFSESTDAKTDQLK
jgi:hypothetical protein